jgi:MFS family permease
MAQAKAIPAPTAVPDKKVAIGLTAVFVAYFTYNFFMNAVNISQPKMVEEFNGMTLFSWLIALPALGSAVSMLMFGKLSDMYGRRAILLTALSMFLVGSVLSAVSTTMTISIASRVILAFGQGALAPLCFAVIGDLFEPAARAKWSGMLNLPAGIAATIAPTLCGMITESSMGWRGLFWVMAPLVLISGVLVSFGIPANTQKNQAKGGLPGDHRDGDCLRHPDHRCFLAGCSEHTADWHRSGRGFHRRLGWLYCRREKG